MRGAEARRERNRAEMRQAVLDAAQKLVGEKGIEGLSLRGIARELGYSPAAIYEYFEGLDDIVLTLYFEGTDGLVVEMSNCLSNLPAETDAPTALMEVAKVFRDHALSAPELYRFTYNVMKQPKNPDEVTDQQTGLGGLISVVTRGIERGELIDVPPFTIALACWTAAHGFVSLEVSDHFTWLRNVGVTDIEGDDAVAAVYIRLMRGVVRGWATEKGKALLPS